MCGMINCLKKKDSVGFAKRYNGPSYKQKISTILV